MWRQLVIISMVGLLGCAESMDTHAEIEQVSEGNVNVPQDNSVGDRESTSRRGYRLSNRDIKGIPVPLEARLVNEDRAPRSLGVDQEIYSVPWSQARIKTFFFSAMQKEGFSRTRCFEYQHVPQCMFRRGSQYLGIEFEDGRFTFTQVSR